jgi:hypothetical protein
MLATCIGVRCEFDAPARDICFPASYCGASGPIMEIDAVGGGLFRRAANFHDGIPVRANKNIILYP